MAAQEYYQGHPQNPNPTGYPPSGIPPQYPVSKPQYLSPYPYPGAPQQQPFQQQFLTPQQPPRPQFPPRIQTTAPPAQNSSQAQQIYPAHLRPARSHSEPPSPRDYERHSHHHKPHGRRRSPSTSSSDSYSRSPSRDRDRSRHRHRHRGSDVGDDRARGGKWADKARGKQDHTARNTFLGAFGGSAIGDLIAPGLGTLGGALLGGIGGNKAGRSRSASNRSVGADRGSNHARKRDKYDEEWEEGRRRRGEI